MRSASAAPIRAEDSARRYSPLRHLVELARVLGVTVEDLLNDTDLPAKQPRKSGPTGKINKLFDELSRLPRRQQDKIAEFVSAFIEQHKRKAS